MEEKRPTAVVACSLDQADLRDRQRRWRQLARRAATDVVTTADGRRLVFRRGPGVEAELRRLAELERECCAFAEWTVRTSADTVVLDVTADTAEGVAAVRGMFAGLPSAQVTEAEQLAALARVHELLEQHGIQYWLFGGWAVDFHAGSVTRPHDDLDLAVWSSDYERIAALLAADGWNHAPEAGENGYTGYERGAVRLELAFLARDETGEVYTPLREGRSAWPDGAFENDVAELAGVRARVISLRALKADKSGSRDDAIVAAKDRADLATLSRLT